MDAPLIVTAAFPVEVQDGFDRLRSELFPPGRTEVGAHLTLFHALPGDVAAELCDAVAALTRRPPLPARISGVLGLGRGVAFEVTSPELAGVHADLRARWPERLTRQDGQGFRAHVTVQNKVDPERARSTAATLRAQFEPFDTTVAALMVWRYVGGPWEHLLTARFAD